MCPEESAVGPTPRKGGSEGVPDRIKIQLPSPDGATAADLDASASRPLYYDTVDLADRSAVMAAIWGVSDARINAEIVRSGAKYRAMRDGAGPSSRGIVRPSRRQPGVFAKAGQRLLESVFRPRAAICSRIHQRH